MSLEWLITEFTEPVDTAGEILKNHIKRKSAVCIEPGPAVTSRPSSNYFIHSAGEAFVEGDVNTVYLENGFVCYDCNEMI